MRPPLSKSAGFVIYRLRQLQDGKGEGIQVRVNGQLIDDVIWDREWADIRSKQEPQE